MILYKNLMLFIQKDTLIIKLFASILSIKIVLLEVIIFFSNEKKAISYHSTKKINFYIKSKWKWYSFSKKFHILQKTQILLGREIEKVCGKKEEETCVYVMKWSLFSTPLEWVIGSSRKQFQSEFKNCVESLE